MPREPPVLALCENQKSSIHRGTSSAKKGGHRHNPNSRWSQKHSLYQRAREEVRDVYDRAHRDQETAETVATKESVLLDVDEGEVLGQGIRYQRKFDLLR